MASIAPSTFSPDATPIRFDALCRLGIYGQVGRLSSTEARSLQRGDAVLTRTARGLEMAEVLAILHANPGALDGTILRKFGPEDYLLRERLQELSGQAFGECQQWIAQQGLHDVLLDVEPLMDGRTLYFHFLGEVTPALNAHLTSLVEIYQEKVAESQFAKLLEHGCGPGCGTEEKGGCGADQQGCAVCVVASACKKPE